MNEVAIIDYGLGNLYSVARAIEQVGGTVRLVDSSAGIDAAQRLILPGVGAFAAGMAGLQSRNLVDAIRSYATSGRPLMGICLGMQMLLECSHEFGMHEGLGIIPGSVVQVRPAERADFRAKIPHVGWGALFPSREGAWQGTAFEQVQGGESAYFVHSYMASPTHAEHRLADINYGGLDICAAVGRGAVVGCQFHPEKSGPTGLKILKNFVERAGS